MFVTYITRNPRDQHFLSYRKKSVLVHEKFALSFFNTDFSQNTTFINTCIVHQIISNVFLSLRFLRKNESRDRITFDSLEFNGNHNA